MTTLTDGDRVDVLLPYRLMAVVMVIRWVVERDHPKVGEMLQAYWAELLEARDHLRNQVRVHPQTGLAVKMLGEVGYYLGLR